MSENALANKMYKGNRLQDSEFPFTVMKGEIVTCILHIQPKETLVLKLISVLKV